MKKFLVLLLAILMVFAIVSCKEPEPEKGELPVEKETGKERLLELGEEPKAVEPTGFKITVTMDDGETPISFTIGGKSGVYWYESFGTTLFAREHDGKTYATTDGSAWVKVADKSLKEEVFTELVDSLLYSAYEDEVKDALLDAGTETKHGRSCCKYTVSVTDEGVAYKFTIWVDKEFGITMGMEAMAGGAAFTYGVTPKLGGLVAEDLPTGYAAALACDIYIDIPLS